MITITFNQHHMDNGLADAGETDTCCGQTTLNTASTSFPRRRRRRGNRKKQQQQRLFDETTLFVLLFVFFSLLTPKKF
jgi:hypothetical protein